MNSLLVAMRVARYTPRSVMRTGAWVGANVGYLRNTKARRRLEGNLALVTGLDGKPLARLTRRGMVSAGRYYAEVLELPRMTPAQIRARVRMENEDRPLSCIDDHNGAVVVLSHSGNWDLVGAKSVLELGPVSAVAEVLKPPEVFTQFVALRERVGIRIYGHSDSGTFRGLLREAGSAEKRLLALVADRDMTGRGVEVTMWGHGVRVAPGPAALAIAGKSPLLPLMVHYERLRGPRRRAARSKWGTVMSFGPVLDTANYTGEAAVDRLTQEWAAWIADAIAKHPEDWHMLQRFGWIE